MILTVWSDIGCPWARLAVERLWAARERLGVDVTFDHRVFALEIVNGRATPKIVLDAETVAVGRLMPEAGWSVWRGRDAEYPVTTLLAMEAVQAAKEQGARAAEQLDRALRTAMFGESKCVSMRHVILDVAESCELVDASALEAALDSGRARAAVISQHRQAVADGSPVKGSPHVFREDGSALHNPGIEMRWEGPKPGGFPVIVSDDPSVYDELLRREPPART